MFEEYSVSVEVKYADGTVWFWDEEIHTITDLSLLRNNAWAEEFPFDGPDIVSIIIDGDAIL